MLRRRWTPAPSTTGSGVITWATGRDDVVMFLRCRHGRRGCGPDLQVRELGHESRDFRATGVETARHRLAGPVVVKMCHPDLLPGLTVDRGVDDVIRSLAANAQPRLGAVGGKLLRGPVRIGAVGHDRAQPG